MTQVVRFHEFGGPEVLRIEDLEVPPPGPGEVRLRVRALGLNRAEVMLRSGHYPEIPDLPSGLGYEAAGEVESLGDGVDGFALGDAVSVIPPLSMIRWPAYAALANFPADMVVKHPDSLGWTEAAAIWMQYVTAYGGLVDIAQAGPGDFVVVTAASSSVGLAAIQVANLVGAAPIAVTRTAAKKQPLVDAGAAHVVVTDDEDLAARLAEITGGAGARIVFDPVGGPAFEPLTASMANGGILLEYGALSPDPTPFPLFTVLTKCLTLRGYRYSEIITDPARFAAAKRFVLDGLTAGALKPIIDRVFAFDQIVEAHRYLESNRQFGKIVVTL